MKLRRFTAKDISSALEKVKEELGSDAIILSTEKKTMKDSANKGFQTLVEVVAAVDTGSVSADRIKGIGHYRSRSSRSGAGVEGEMFRQLRGEIADLKEELLQLSSMIRQLQADRQGESEQHLLKGARARHSKVAFVLSRLGLDKGTEARLMKQLLSKGRLGPESQEEIISWLQEYIAQGVRQGPVAEDFQERFWWAFIGPTGVGKTTTLAKIAARLKFICGKRGLLVSVDSYRVGALEQLQRLADLMDIPLEVARTNKDLIRIFGNNQDKDFILVDTTGRNPFNSSHKIELDRLFDAVPGLMAQVMLSATSKREDILGAIGFYKRFPVAGWTLTKVDETRVLAPAVFPIIEAGLPLSYVTTGQRVPEDIRCVSGKDLAGMTLAPFKELPGTRKANEPRDKTMIC